MELTIDYSDTKEGKGRKNSSKPTQSLPRRYLIPKTPYVRATLRDNAYCEFIQHLPEIGIVEG